MARVAIVTGGTRGIGEAISIMLKDTGMKVAANYAGNEERARGFTERTGIPAYKWDVADFEACQKGVSQVETELGPVDVLVNNAGITRDSTMKRMDHDKWQQVIDTNLGGCFNMAKAVFEGMVGRGYGRIVNIGSVTSVQGSAGLGPYGASRGGIRQLTMSLAADWGAHGITVNCLAPGWFKTKQNAILYEDAGCVAYLTDRIPLQRTGRPEDLEGAVIFLASDASAYITGQLLLVDGGISTGATRALPR